MVTIEEREEREEIIQQALEAMLRMLPEVVGNLMKANSMYSKLTSKFYKDNPYLANHTDIVKETVAEVEGQNPTKTYDEILQLALPKIKSHLVSKGTVNMDLVDKSSLCMSMNGAL